MLVFGREEKRRALQFIGAQLNTIVVLSRAIAFSKVYPGWILANKVFVNPANSVLNGAGVPVWQSAVKSFSGK